MGTSRFSILWFVPAVMLFLGSAGCELIAGIDRTQIPTGEGGAGAEGGGGQGGGTPCTTEADCPAPANECEVATCTAGQCGMDFIAAGTATTAQTDGDCQQNQCDGNGAIISADDDTDLPDDNNVCTDDLCTAGMPSNPFIAAGTSCGTDLVCDGNGACVGCNVPTDCPGQDTECQTRTCVANVCGVMYAPSGTPLTAQIAGDCLQDECDGAGAVMSVNLDTDVPVDGDECTADVCTAGVPSNPLEPAGTACTQGGGQVCDSAGQCVECIDTSTCPGQDTECQQRTCTAGACGLSFTAAGTPLSMQISGDCLQDECDGNGSVISVNLDTDLPVDGNECTDDVCTAGVASNPFSTMGAPCMQSGGNVCDGAGVCVECLAATDCPGQDTECQTRTCTAGACGFSYAPAGTVLVAQTPGDCLQAECDGTGGVVTPPLDTDLPVDNNDCTDDVCMAGVPSNPPFMAGTACTQGGGVQCDGAGMCVECLDGTQCASGVCTGGFCQMATCSDTVQNGSETDVDCGGGMCAPCITGLMCMVPADCYSSDCTGGVCQPPTVVSTLPADGAIDVPVSAFIHITFSAAMDPATLSMQTVTGPCTGSIQVSTDNFATCIGFTAATPALSGGDTIATLTPSPWLSYASTYQIRVTTAATDAGGDPLAADYTSATGFVTAAPPPSCDGSVVISEVYGGASPFGFPAWHNDYVELHNRGSSPVDLTGWSVQYQAIGASIWTVTALSGTLQPGGYYLMSAAAALGGTTLPTPDVSNTGINIAAGAGKIALVSSTTALTGTCPSSALIVDFVGYGTTATCFEGQGPTPDPSTTNSVSRGDAGCTDTDNNEADFTAGAGTPQNSMSAASVCGCVSNLTANESNAPEEADYCVLQFPATLSVPASQMTSLVYGRIYEAGVTDPAGASAMVTAEVGWGPTTLNPTTQSGWQFFPTTFNMQFGNDEEYQASFTAPAMSGTYWYAYRVSLDGGAHWTYCDLNGAGSNAGLGFEITQLGTLTVP